MAERIRVEAKREADVDLLKKLVAACVANHQFAEQNDALRAENVRLTAEVAMMREALEPFAKLWDQVDEWDRVRRAWHVTVRTTSDAIRRARAAIHPTEREGEGNG